VARFGDSELLSASHAIDRFASGVSSLDTWLTEHALEAGGTGSARTYVVTDAKQEGRVIGYHAIAAASVARASASRRATKGMPAHPVPAILLARLAVDKPVQGQGAGAWLLRDAMRRALSVSEELGVRVLLVHVIDKSALSFYERFGFETSSSDPFNLQLLIKDIRKTLNLPPP
jgi:GNAT superfamily N-acetyltransferase